MTQPNQDAGEELLRRLDDIANRFAPDLIIGVCADAAAEIRKLRKMVAKLPKDAAGETLSLGTRVWIVESLAGPSESGYGRPPHFIDGMAEATVASIGGLGAENRRATFIQDAMSFCVTADLRGVFRNRAAALVAAAAPGEGK